MAQMRPGRFSLVFFGWVFARGDGPLPTSRTSWHPSQPSIKLHICVCTCCCLSAGAFVQGSSVLSWVGNNTAKLQLQHGGPHSNMQCWTLISTNSYGQVGAAAQL
jgi:hypothetical protein